MAGIFAYLASAILTLLSKKALPALKYVIFGIVMDGTRSVIWIVLVLVSHVLRSSVVNISTLVLGCCAALSRQVGMIIFF